MISVVLLVVALVFATFGFWFRSDAYLLEISLVVAGIAATNLTTRIAIFDRKYLWTTVLAGTVYRATKIRVSIAYLVAVPVDGTQLLVRGHRITTQFQPVGGVFKYWLEDSEMVKRFDAAHDSRFAPDARSKKDLRLRLPGRSVHRLLRWFESRQDRELFPVREFHEELIEPGILRGEDFPYFDCAYLGTRNFPLRHDTFSGLRQLIIAEVYELRPTERQAEALRDLKRRHEANPDPNLHFATQEEIERRAAAGVTQSTYDIAPTAVWLLGRTRS
ncbi:hypothetical protein NCC78_02405 [Micromonospora phytophila]|uniref:SMODS-associated NUDIX domain-containing protein n=1 Tax=Micromonospora phytophila TaxID=709888 RepID=UPI0020307810|nr:hypothetical protein [Micromonospora phytophila]MCM0673573.1 hypothetical protein [Micromonospora phytophila]